jgi:hypothetical protein
MAPTRRWCVCCKVFDMRRCFLTNLGWEIRDFQDLQMHQSWRRNFTGSLQRISWMRSKGRVGVSHVEVINSWVLVSDWEDTVPFLWLLSLHCAMSLLANATQKPEKGVYITSMATTFPNMNTKVKKKIRCFFFSLKRRFVVFLDQLKILDQKKKYLFLQFVRHKLKLKCWE